MSQEKHNILSNKVAISNQIKCIIHNEKHFHEIHSFYVIVHFKVDQD